MTRLALAFEYSAGPAAMNRRGGPALPHAGVETGFQSINSGGFAMNQGAPSGSPGEPHPGAAAFAPGSAPGPTHRSPGGVPAFSAPHMMNARAEDAKEPWSGIGGLSFAGLDGLASPSKIEGWEPILAVVQGVAGFIVLVASLAYLASFTRLTGLLIGGMLLALGAVGFLGLHRSSSRLLSAYVVLALLCLLLTFNFLSLVQRDVEVDCAIAGLWIRAQDMEGHLRREAHTEMVSQLMTRLGELEDSLEMVQSGAVKAAQLFADREQLRMNDRSYIKNKLQTLKKHAEEVIEDMLGSEKGMAEMTARERQELIERFSRAEDLLGRLEEAHRNPLEDFTYEEYRTLLDALTSLHSEHLTASAPATITDPDRRQKRHQTAADIAMAAHDLPSVQGVMARHSRGADGYSSLSGGAADVELQSMNQGLVARRRRWEQRLRGYLNDIKVQEHRAKGGVMDALEDMPEHCLRELQAQRPLRWASLVVLAVQVVGAYGVLSAVMRRAVKKRSAD